MSDPESGLHTQPSLLVRIRDAQDAESWKKFVDAYAPLIYRYCRHQGLQDADAADVGQEVLAQVARSMRTFEYQPERGRFRDWLGTVTRNKIRNSFTRKSHRVRGAGGSEESGVLDQVVAPEAEAEWTAQFNACILQAALERIRPEFDPIKWQAFERTWLEQQSAAEVARVLDLPIEMVYVAKSLALKRLREEVLILAEDLAPFVPLA